MESQRQRRAGSWSSQDGERCDGEEELPGEFHRDAETHRAGDADTKSGSSANKAADEPPRLNFHIPRRKKEKRALFQYLLTDSREFAEILTTLTSSYKDPASCANFTYSKPRLVHSESLEKDFMEKRKELKQEGRTDKELAESFCFLLCDSYKVPVICEKGYSVGSSWMNILGNSSKGVYLCQFSDLLQVSSHEPGSTGEIIIFKVIKGRVKSIHENMCRTLDPTPKFDSHFSKNANRVTSLQSYKAFEYTQQYFYEYVDYELSSRPRHVCPYAVVSFQFKGKETTSAGPKPLPLRSSVTSGREQCSYIVWKGHFVNAGKEFSQASFHCFSQPFLPFKLPDRMEIGKVMRLGDVKRTIPFHFSWDLYSGSHEVFKKGLHCCLLEVVEEKSKSGESLTELFQKLEEQGLVMVNLLSERGFLFLLSSGQMSNLSERRSGWKKSNLHALFIYTAARDVSKFSSKPPAACEPLLPVPPDSVMPHLKTFLPALHYALGKVRGTPPASFVVGVEKQAHDYLSSMCKGNLVQRVRLDYEHKLDDREKLFPAPRQKHLWESFMRSYLYNPAVFTLPVEKASGMVEALGVVPESSAPADTAEYAGNAQGDPKKLKELLKIIQKKKTLKEAKQKEKGSEESSADTKGLKRKSADEAQEINPKSMKVTPLDEEKQDGDAETLHNMLSSFGLRDTDLRRDETQGASAMIHVLDRLTKVNQDTDLRKDKLQGSLVVKILEQISKTITGSSLAGTDETAAEESGETALIESVTKLGLPANCDIDLRRRFADNEREPQGKNDLEKLSVRVRVKRKQGQAGQEETAGSLSSLEAFSPCSDTNGQQRGVNLLGERTIPWVLIPITGLKTDRYCYRDYHKDENVEDPRFLRSPLMSTPPSPERAHISAAPPLPPPLPEQPDSSNIEPDAEPEDSDTNLTDELKFSHCQEQRGAPLSGVDSIVNAQISNLSTEVEDLLREEHVCYVPYSHSQPKPKSHRSPTVPFSEYISHFNTPLPVHSYITSFRDSISAFIDPLPNKWDLATHTLSVSPSPAHSAVSSSAPDTTSCELPLPSPGTAVTKPQSFTSQHSLPNLDGSIEISPDIQMMERQGEEAASRFGVEAQSRLGLRVEEAIRTEPANEDVAAVDSTPAPATISSLISQLQPEVISNLVEIIRGVQKNVVHFYVHSADEESDVCWEIKEYLRRLGNAECDPQTFLEKKDRQDKLLVIIQNIEIATNVHKIPALVSLKKLPSVSFAGVDSLDDIRNHTYNELFVSGGFIVSDEFVLNPDFITQERLQTLLQYLEELNTPESPWRWWVHCKTHKKVKEQSRCKSEALSVLNLLTAYHKKQIVEFLSYHECDASSHQAPDLDCLVKLQAQNIRQRHVIFLTERRFEMFPHYSSSGIVIANIDDVLYSMASLISEAGDKPFPEAHSCPTSPTLKEDNMVLDTDLRNRNTPGIYQPSGHSADPYQHAPNHIAANEVDMDASALPPVEVQNQLDFEALKAAISQFRVAREQANAGTVQTLPGSLSATLYQSHLGQSDLHSPHSQSPAERFVSTSDLEASQVVPQPSSHVHPKEPTELGLTETSSSNTLTRGFGHDCQETVSTLKYSAAFQHGAQVEARSQTNVVQQTNLCETAETGASEAVGSIPTLNQTTNMDTIVDTVPSPGIPEKETDHNQGKDAAEVTTSENSTLTTVSSWTHSKNGVVSGGGGKQQHSRTSLLPVPESLACGIGNSLVHSGVERMLLQSGGLWSPSPQASGLASHSISPHNSALGLRSSLLNSSLGVVTPTGLRGLFPNSNQMTVAWNSLGQGAASNAWVIPQGLGRVHRPTAQFMQSYGWHGNPAFQGNGYPPRRGSYGGW